MFFNLRRNVPRTGILICTNKEAFKKKSTIANSITKSIDCFCSYCPTTICNYFRQTEQLNIFSVFFTLAVLFAGDVGFETHSVTLKIKVACSPKRRN
jgi:hypothetical protein